MIDAEVSALLARLAGSGSIAAEKYSVQAMRARSASLAQLYGEGPSMGTAVDTVAQIPDHPPVKVRVLTPTATPKAVVIYLHGGGWVAGSVDAVDTLGRRLAQRLGAVVVLVEYRLAPERRFPGAVEDAWTVTCWAARQTWVLGKHELPIVVAGDSAGGNLAAAVAQRSSWFSDGPRVALQVLAYPALNCDFTTDSYLDPENGVLISRDMMIWLWDQYVPCIEMRRRRDACPLLGAVGGEMPPGIVLTAEHDVLRSEGVAYANALAEARALVAHRQFPGQIHGFFTMVGLLSAHDDALDYIVTETQSIL